MTQSVIDLSSNLEENLERWAKALKAGGNKLAVFKVVYSSKRRRWTAKEITNKLKGRVVPKRVTECGKKLVGDGLLRQLPAAYPVVYEKLDDVHHYKRKILSHAANNAKRRALPTKRRAHILVNVRSKPARSGKAVEITVDDIEQFAKVRRIRNRLNLIKPISESRFKKGLQRLFQDTGKFKDWSGERNDFFTNKLKIKGNRYSAAFALKGPGVRVKTMSPGNWGKQGNQIQRLTEAPATVFMLQFEGQIDQYSIDQLKRLTEHKANQEGKKLFYGYIDRDDSLRLRHAYPSFF